MPTTVAPVDFATAAASAAGAVDEHEPTSWPLNLWRWFLWLSLPALASLMLLATTNHVCQDVASVPLLWVVPLSLYLLTFIICFDQPRFYVREVFVVLAMVTALLALAGAILFGINLFATSRVADELPLAWTVLPARVAGVLGVTIPLLLMRRLRLVSAAVPFVIVVGIAEVAGTLTYAFGARDSTAITAVLASQFAGIAAIAAFVLFGERLNRVQVAGVVTIAIGVGLLALFQAL